MGDTWESIKKRFEFTFVRARSISDTCNTLNIDQVKDLVGHAANQTKRAKTVAAFANSAIELGKAGNNLRRPPTSSNDLAEKGSSALGDVKGRATFWAPR